VRSVAGLLLIFSALASTPQPVRERDPMPGFPRMMLWAWERPENLNFLNPHLAGVAMLAGTITVGNGELRCQPRLQPLRMPPATPLMLTVRVESLGNGLPVAADVATCTLAWTTMPGAQALQIDFDARRSERAWYRDFLAELRQRLPKKIPLTITALASWCEQDGWIRGLPISEAVPMLFRMGQGEVWNRLDFEVPLCRSSVGIATDELPGKLPRGRRLYFFHPGRWTEDVYHAAWKESRRLQ
jgi:Protein of unknown function (DUF3142)